MFTPKELTGGRKRSYRNTSHTKRRKSGVHTSERRERYSESELQHYREIVTEMRKEAVSLLNEYRESLRSIDHVHTSEDSREQPASFYERSVDAGMREEYAMLIERQARLLRYLDAALARIQGGDYGICTSCNELIAPERLKAVPHTQLCLRCKGGGVPTTGR